MSLEKYIAIASLALYGMFVGEIISVFIFLDNPQIGLEPAPKILQYISIGAAPAMVLSGTAFLMSKRYGSKQVGSLIVAGGAVLLVGMAYANSLVEKIEPTHLVLAVTLTPPMFMAVSIPIIIVGLLLFRVKKRKPKKEYF